MRSFLAGIFLLVFATTGALAQVTGRVDSIGFGDCYRPDCWVPLRVHLDSTADTPGEYQIQVHQQDLDKDTVVYARTITLGPQAHQDYWVCFIPQPTGRKGMDGGSLPQQGIELNEMLQVHLYDKTGRTEITRLPIRAQATNIDKANEGGLRHQRGVRLILGVTENDQIPAGQYDGALGLLTDVLFINVKTRDLPESVLAYQAVDGIVWFDANATEISTGGAKAFDAIQQYVQQGGQLVICQPEERLRISPFAEAGMLPVMAKDARGEWAIEARQRTDLTPLIHLAAREGIPSDDWKRLERGSWDFFRATPAPGAVVDDWITWNSASPGDASADRSPYIARLAYGMGTVTWVAQDLGDRRLTINEANGWPRIWNAVLGWKDEPITKGDLKIAGADRAKGIESQWESGFPIDLGAPLHQGMEHAARGVAYIFVAVLFFIGYWIVAGPGSYFFLAARRRKGLSWMAFGVVALAAAGLTVLVVKLVLRGSPEIRHVSIVKLSPAPPAADGTTRFSAVVDSQFGLYIPRDGDQTVSVTHNTAGLASYLTPYAIHPQYESEEAGFTDRAKYVVHTDNYESGKPVSVDVPFRSTLKKLQAQWIGTVSDGIIGAARVLPSVLDPRDPRGRRTTFTISGRLTNKTGHDLAGIYFGFNYQGLDWLMYMDAWKKDAILDLQQEFLNAPRIGLDKAATDIPSNLAGIKSLKSQLSRETWGRFWFRSLGSGIGGTTALDDPSYTRALPMMAFFSRIEPQRGERPDFVRWELQRRGGRDLDVAPLMAAGQLVIVGRTGDDTPLPLPLEVNGDKVEGQGIIFYETGLPLDRSALQQAGGAAK